MIVLVVALSKAPSQEDWDIATGFLYQFHTQGIDEGEIGAPVGNAALHTGNEFEEAIENVPFHVCPKSFKAYFMNRQDTERALRTLEPILQKYSPQFEVKEEEDEIDYSESWKSNFKPIELPNWFVRAGWHEKKKLKKNQREIIINPGMAFGTGSHYTTQSCLKLISTVKRATSALDFGCGSGILSIALKKHGIKNVFAVDIDPLSIKATKRNARINKCTGIKVILGKKEKALPYKKNQFQLIVANILKNTLLEFAESFALWIKPGGTLILSGLLSEQEKEILTAYKSLGFKKIKRILAKEKQIDAQGEDSVWVSLLLKKS